jgi:hypothetical protein
MNSGVDMSKVAPIAEMRGDDTEDTDLLHDLLSRARTYLESFPWHRGVQDAYFGLGVGGIVGVFLFKVRPSEARHPHLTWVVVGDLPPAYISVDDAPNPATALDSYIGAMEDWVQAARGGASVDGLVPVEMAPTPENATKLEARLRFLDEEILESHADDLRN